MNGESEGQDHDGLGGLYVTGWLKRGPNGIIGTNIVDAKDTVATIIKDLEEHPPSLQKKDHPDVVQVLRDRGVKVVDWQGYHRIDATETNPNLKRSEKQPREKLTTRSALLEAAFGLTESNDR
jgi:NADPH-dependent glutamate synthase beta subunit-like oxidoreductase